MLELVLALPILMFVTALIINFGTAACWKARADMTARHMIWASRHLDDPDLWVGPPQVPNYWRGGRASAEKANDILSDLDDARLQHPVVRGPSFPDFNVTVKRDLLNPAAGFSFGLADRDLKYPLLARAMKRELTQDKDALMKLGWEFWSDTMNLGDNIAPRTPLLYRFYQSPGNPVEQLKAAYLRIAGAIWDLLLTGVLNPLDRDEEWLMYVGYSPDFHPGLYLGCTSNESYIQRRVDSFSGNNGSVHRLPKRMTRAFIALYRYAAYNLQAQLSADPPPAPDVQAQIREQIAQLQAKINTLQAFYQTL